MEISNRVNPNEWKMLYINIIGNIVMAPAVRKKNYSSFPKGGRCFGRIDNVTWHFSLENQSLLCAFLPSFFSAYQFC